MPYPNAEEPKRGRCSMALVLPSLYVWSCHQRCYLENKGSGIQSASWNYGFILFQMDGYRSLKIVITSRRRNLKGRLQVLICSRFLQVEHLFVYSPHLMHHVMCTTWMRLVCSIALYPTAPWLQAQLGVQRKATID